MGRVRAEGDDLTARRKCANAEIARLRGEAEAREANAVSIEKMREKYEKKIAVLEDRLRGYRDYRARVARMAAMGTEDEVVWVSVLKEGGELGLCSR